MTYEGEIDYTQAEYYMHECFELAKSALGRTSPNPVVGAIVLDKNGIPAGKGCHLKAGTDHAEVIAIREAGELAKGGTLVVNLEPCCHVGRTNPCCDLIIWSQIKEVVFSTYDPNPLVNKEGERKLINSGINVIPKVLEQEGQELNKFFFKWVKVHLPWITLKQAQTLDGKVALKNNKGVWISSELARQEVHSLRNIYDVVLVGASTVEKDDPKLTVRSMQDGRNPIRVVVDPELVTRTDANVYKDTAPVFLITKPGHPKDKLNSYLANKKHIQLIEIPGSKSRIDLYQLFVELGKRGILSVLVEAGPTLASELVLNNLIDEYILFISPKVFATSDSLSSLAISTVDNASGAIDFQLVSYKTIGNDLMLSLRPYVTHFY